MLLTRICVIILGVLPDSLPSSLPDDIQWSSGLWLPHDYNSFFYDFIASCLSYPVNSHMNLSLLVFFGSFGQQTLRLLLQRAPQDTTEEESVKVALHQGLWIHGSRREQR